MTKEVTDWFGFKRCDKCWAKDNEPCMSLKTSAPTPVTKPHPGRPKDSDVRRARGLANAARTKRFNRAIGLR
jgi:hypothetical protein